jgi:5'-3' exonuclease
MSKNKYAELLNNITNKVQDKHNSVLIIDGLNTFLRSFAIINDININGHHIGGLTGALKSIGYAIKTLYPTKVIIVFDGIGGSSSRKNIFPEYKANRHKSRITNHTIFKNQEEEYDSINNQMKSLLLYLQCTPVTLLSIDGLEADDIMGYLVKKYENDSSVEKTYVMSTDQDFLQLVTDKTYIYSPTKKKIYTPSLIKEEYGVSVNNFLAQKILLGDSGDNVPGVPKLGKVKLLKLFPQLVTENTIYVDDILKIALENREKHSIYDSVLGMQHQLHINSEIMDLHHLELSNENVNIIEDKLKIHNKLDKRSLLSMYYGDVLGESIPNVERWIDEVFGSLNIN